MVLGRNFEAEKRNTARGKVSPSSCSYDGADMNRQQPSRQGKTNGKVFQKF